MAANPSVSEFKAQAGTSRPQNPEKGKGGTVLGIEQKFLKVDGKPSLVRSIEGKEHDIWREVFDNTNSKMLEWALSIASQDSEYNLVSFIRQIEYQGFDREFYIKHALSKMSVETFVKFAILGALRGSNFQKIMDTCESPPQDLVNAYGTCGFVKTPKKRTDLTILRNTACIPHWCSYWLLKSGSSKKIPGQALHECLQFPGAASLPMSRAVRLQHMEFSQAFSQLLPGGQFNLNIYVTAYNNQIPVKNIPQEVLELLQVSSSSDSYSISNNDIETFSKAVVGPRR